jgi:hypothetical protein
MGGFKIKENKKIRTCDFFQKNILFFSKEHNARGGFQN